ncbi:MAG: DNA repair protein RecN [Elusimicrobiales bacterium]|nr:DNA repair protein RecN [Elusimicrobiales bacterium]
MLTKLTIKNFAVMESLEIEPGPGLNILTGETGAGKSIIISALGFLLGERSGTDIVRPGAASAEVEGTFKAANIPSSMADTFRITDGIVRIYRMALPNGKSKAKVNGHSVSVARLAELGSFLIDFHGQNEHQSLLKPETQRSLLDSYGHLENEAAEVARLHAEVSRLSESLNAVSLSESERERLLDLYKYQLEDIENADLKQGEKEELEAAWPRLKNADRLSSLSGETLEQLEEAVSAAEKGLDIFRQLAADEPHFKKDIERLESSAIELQDLAEGIREYADSLNADPEEVNRCLARMEQIRKLEKKYGGDYAGIMKTAETLRKKISGLEDMTLDREETERRLAEAEEKLSIVAENLSNRRREVAKKLSEEVVKEADGLGFKEVRFCADVLYDDEKITSHGGDQIEYLFTANPGYPLRPLRYGASGGEMARVMLAIKNVLARADRIETQVFDEVDTGCGAVTGRLVGRKLNKLAHDKQIFCITHLAQVAAYGSRHYFVRKTVKNGIAAAQARILSDSENEAEIARMIGGKENADDISLEHARKLIEECKGENL